MSVRRLPAFRELTPSKRKSSVKVEMELNLGMWEVAVLFYADSIVLWVGYALLDWDSICGYADAHLFFLFFFPVFFHVTTAN